jgi:DNA/RNA-binding domain of Phe-tRNA-synthetase-like protein
MQSSLPLPRNPDGVSVKSFDAQPALDLFPGAALGFLTVPSAPYPVGGDSGTSERVIGRLRDSHGSAEAVRGHLLWEEYRAFYTAMNVKASAVSTPLKQAARFLKAGAYRPIHPVVDVCMEIEYALLCSFQVYDLARIGAAVRYAPAVGGESLVDAPEGAVARAGECVLSDELGLIHSPSLGNDHARLVGEDSTEALVRILRIPGMDRSVFDRTVDEAARRLDAREVVVLDAAHPAV